MQGTVAVTTTNAVTGWSSIAEAVLLSIVALMAAWSGYAAAKWSTLAVGGLIEAAGVGVVVATCRAIVAAYGCWAFARRKIPEHEEGSSAIQ